MTKTTTISVKLAAEDLEKLDKLAATWDPEDWKKLDVDPNARWRSRYGPPTRGQVLRALVRSSSCSRKSKTKTPAAR